MCIRDSTGVDPYSTAVSDTYQDLFGEGIFTGKGLYDVDAFRESVDGRAPENALLSHDLFEGLHARTALASDVELVDDYPANVLAHARRQHRWVRGAWQILLWLFPMVPSQKGFAKNTLPLISQWKILDNLRRSLVSPSLLAMLAGGWLFGPGPAWFWLLVVAAVVCVPPLLSAVIELLRKPAQRNWLVHAGLTGGSVLRPIVLAVLSLVLLPYDALICTDAILRSGVRMPVSYTHLTLPTSDLV